MIELPSEIKLEKGEKIKTILKRKYDSWIFPVIILFSILFIIILIIMAILYEYAPIIFFGIFPLAYVNVYLAVAVTILEIIGLLVFVMIIGWFYVGSHKYIITNKKIIIYKKFIILSQRETTYSRITDLLLNVGIFGRLLNFGEIIPVSGAMEGAIAPSLNYSLRGVFNPVKVFDLINDLRIFYEQGGLEERGLEEESSELSIDEDFRLEELPSQIHLFPEEKVIMILGRKYLSFFFRIIWFAMIPMILMFLFLYFSLFPPPDPTGGQYNIFAMMFSIWFWIMFSFSIVGILVLTIGVFYVRGHSYYITNYRIIMLRVFVSIRYREIDYDDISDITISKGPFARIFNYGTMQPLTFGVEFGLTSFFISITGVPNPHEIRTKILELMRRYKEKKF
ncbi:MAG: PH domain-containing protein [Candidatus Helarchaeota archaeon]